MQLTTLLARLTPEERKIVVERHLGPNAVALDDKTLASHLAQPMAMAPTLAELNFGQLLLLRWLGTRPNLEATWSELLEAIGDRLLPDLRDAYLRELRLWALVDYHPTERGGWVATYPAAIASLPASRQVQLGKRLPEFSTDLLSRMATALGRKNIPSRKDGRIALIMQTLSTPETCRQVVEQLSPTARALFEWVREHDGRVTVQQMDQRAPRRRNAYSYYMSIDSFWQPVPKGETLDPVSELVRRGLVLPAAQYGASWYGMTGYAIPEEVEMAYSGRTLLDLGPMQPPPLAPADQVTGTVPNPAGLLRDVAHLLGFVAIGRCEWRQDGEPYKRSLTALGKMLGSVNAEYPEMLWTLAAGTQLVQRARRGAVGYQAAIGVDATPRQLFDSLLLGWLQTGGSAPLANAVPSIGQEARLRLLQLLQAMPPDTWVLESSLNEWLRFHWPMTFRPELLPLHVTPPDPGLTSLGHILLGRGSTPDGQRAVMIPAAHQQLLLSVPAEPGAGADDPADGILPPWDDSWIVQPDRSIIAPPNASPDAVVELWKVAQLESNQGASMFRITSESIAAALNRSMTPAEIRALLEKRSRVPLPPTVERLIDDQGKRYGRIKVGAAQTYVKVDDPALLAELRRDKRLQKLHWIDVAPGIAFVVGDAPAAVLDTLRKAGYLPVSDQERPRQITPLPDQGRPPQPAPAPGQGRPPQLAAVPTARPDGASPSPARRAPTANDVLRLARTALREDRLLYVTWMDGGDPREGELEIIDLHGREIHANNLDDGEEVLFFPDDVLEVELGDPLDDDIDLSFLDD